MGAWIGVDVGGTGVRAGRVGDDGVEGGIVGRPLEARTVEAVVAAVVAAVEVLGPADGVGVGVPGFVRGPVVVASPNFPTWDHEPVAALVQRALGWGPVVVENDANAATWGAWHAMGGPAAGDVVALTLGTGVGGGVVSEGRLLRGRRGTAAELGHIAVGGDRRCGCGGIGCLETWCSTVGLLAASRELGLRVDDGRELLDLAEAGDERARSILHEAGRALGRAWVALANVFAPDRIVMMGGLVAARTWWEPLALPALREHAVLSSRDVAVTWWSRAEDLAIPGAARVAASAAPPRRAF